VTTPPGGFAAAAVRADRAVFRAAHPVAFPLVRGLARLGPVLRVPGLGAVVNDPDLVRRVLVDADRFRKDGPGSPGELWTPVVGPRALTNMEGPEHRRLRATLAGLLTAENATALVERAMAPGLTEVTERLRAGERVDVAAAVRSLVGAVVFALIGAPDQGEAGHRKLVRQAEELTGMVGLRTRRLAPADVVRAREVLAGVTGPAARAWSDGRQDTAPGRMRGLGLEQDAAAGVAGVLFLTGTETVTSFLPRLVGLLTDSGLLAHDTVEGTLGRLDAVIDDALQVTVPTPITVRRAAADARVGRLAVRAGERVLVMTVNAAWSASSTSSSTRTTAHSTARSTVDLKQLWFGAGPHFCLGRPLALAEARALITALAGTVTGCGGTLATVRRRPRRGVLIPSWQELTVVLR
jgi:cytochrome P450